MRWRWAFTAIGVVSGISHAAAAVEDVAAHRPAAGEAIGPGDRGTEVVRWQDDLNEWRASRLGRLGPIGVDGVFGPETEAATRLFQEAHPGVPTDLTVDDRDRTALSTDLGRRPD